jgi:hypothetical protein
MVGQGIRDCGQKLLVRYPIILDFGSNVNDWSPERNEANKGMEGGPKRAKMKGWQEQSVERVF